VFEPAEFRKLVAARMRVLGGYRRLRRYWWLGGADVQWAVELRKIQWGPSFAIETFLDLQNEVQSVEPYSYPVQTGENSLPPFRDRPEDAYPRVWEVLQLKSGLGDEERLAGLDVILAMVDGYLKSHLTLVSVVDAYRAGDFDSSFIFREARAFLEAGGGVWPAEWSNSRELAR
jgi:hypothetical protein